MSEGVVEKPVENGGRRVGKFVVVGIVLTGLDFLVCALLTRVIFRTNEMQEVASLISTAVATVAAYLMHSRITWKERRPRRGGVAMFLIWNGASAVVIKPGATWLLKLPFGGDNSVWAFLVVYGLVTAIAMVLNFLFYDRLVFGKKGVIIR